MKFENKGKWLKEAEEEKLVFDNREQADFLDGDDKVLTMEDDEELSGELLDEVESDEVEDLEPVEEEDDALDSPEDEEDAIVMAEDFRPDDTVPQSKQMDFKKQYLKGKDARKINKNSFYFDGIHAVDDQSGSDIPGAVLGMKYKDLAAALDKFFESAQKNEAKLDKGYDINFDNIGGGFEVIQTAITNGYGIELSGYSNNTGKKLTFVHSTLSNDSGLTQDERREHYDGLNAKRTAIAKDLKPLADKFDKDIEAVFAKHGFKKQ